MDKKKLFSKSSISISDQLVLLKKRGLIIEDQESAYHHLSTVSYYRLSGYYKIFLEPHNTSHQFRPNTSFDQIWSLYTFDRELRLIITDAIERIEVALRTALCNVLGSKYDSLWYLSKNDPFSKKWTSINPGKKKSPRDYFMNEVDDIVMVKKKNS